MYRPATTPTPLLTIFGRVSLGVVCILFAGCGLSSGQPVVSATPPADAGLTDTAVVRDGDLPDASLGDVSGSDAGLDAGAEVGTADVLPGDAGADGAAGDVTVAADAPAPTPGNPLSAIATLPMIYELTEVRAGSDGTLYVCSGMQNLHRVDAHDPAAMVDLGSVILAAGGVTYGACQHIAVAPDAVYIAERGDHYHGGSSIAALDFPGGLPRLLATYTDAGHSFEGVAANGRMIYAAMHADGLAVLERTDAGIVLRGTVTGLTNAWGVAAAGTTVYVANDVGGLAVIDASTPTAPRLVGQVAIAGSAHMVAVDAARHLAFVAAGVAGLVVVDVSDPANPSVIAHAALPSAATDVGFSGSRVYVAAWGQMRMYDTSRPNHPVLTASRTAIAADGRLTRIFSVAPLGDLVFAAEWLGMHAYRFVPGVVAPSITSDSSEVDFGRVSVGVSRTATVTVENVGLAPLNVSAITTSGPPFTVSPDHLALGPGATAEVTVTYLPIWDDIARGTLTLASDDPASPVVHVPILGDIHSLEAGDPAPDVLVDTGSGTPWSLTAQRGHTVLVAYFATWCPVCGVEFPDLEAQIWQRFRARGLVMMAADLGTDIGPGDTLDAIHTFVQQTRVTFPAGMDTTGAARSLVGDHSPRSSLLPILIVVDAAGNVAQIELENNLDAVSAALDRLLPP